jgi:hypothetical protein
MYTSTYDASGEKWATRTFACAGAALAAAAGTMRTQAAMTAAAMTAIRERRTSSPPG